MIADKNSRSTNTITTKDPFSHALWLAFVFWAGVVAVSVAAALLLPRGFLLAAIGDFFQVGMVAAATFLCFRNALQSESRLRAFWVLVGFGCGMWLCSLMFWSVYELYFRKPVPDLPFADLLLFLKIVPLTSAIVLEPQRSSPSRFRTFGLLDVCILTIYSLYLYSFYVLIYRLVPGSVDTYNFQFNVADAIANQTLLIAAGIAIFRSESKWKALYRLYFASIASYCVASNVSNVAIDLGRYYTGSLYDVPFTAAVAGLVCFTLIGARVSATEVPQGVRSPATEGPASRSTFLSSHLAMLVTVSTPAIGIWLLTSYAFLPKLFPVRLGITLLTIFILTLLLSIKQDLLTTSLLRSLQGLSATYTRIERFENHLVQTEKLTSLGEAVAQSANQIKEAMISIRELAETLSKRLSGDPRIPAMAGKIAHYAVRTDSLVQNMLRFAQETPIQLSPTEIKPLLESAIQLSRIAKLPNLRVNLRAQEDCPLVQGDSSQLLHVFLHVLANAADALEELGGIVDISLASIGAQLLIQFADSGSGIKDPEHVFEPFYTTKPVGKGTGLGLSTCYGIIQQHKGEIFCRNRPEGGALFAITLPAITGDKTSARTGEPQVAGGVI
jgi:signal transduction histidine kinase